MHALCSVSAAVLAIAVNCRFVRAEPAPAAVPLEPPAASLPPSPLAVHGGSREPLEKQQSLGETPKGAPEQQKSAALAPHRGGGFLRHQARGGVLAIEPAPPPETAAAMAIPPLQDEELAGEVISLEGEAPYVPVASQSVRDRDFLLRPHPRPADILRVVPGMFVNQHSGGGKANQYFLRGFDADHGTDIALSVDGVPVNMVSHGHGQGYADLNFVIPELVERIDIVKGPYAAAEGDFATAGAVDFLTHRSMDSSSLSLTVGRFDTYRLLGILSPAPTESWSSLLAGEAYFTNGPFDNGEGYLRYNTFARATHQAPRASLSLTITSYGGGWNGSGQLPLREVEAGRLARFGSLDASEGGNSSRHSAYARYRVQPDEQSELELLAYAIRYGFTLYSNFTFLLEDPLNGDQIEQIDDRVVTGTAARYRFRRRWAGMVFDTTLGSSVRADAIDNALYRTSRRERFAKRVDATIHQTSIGLYAQEDTRWTSWLRTVIGARLDYIGFRVTDVLEELNADGVTGSGVREKAIASPKASLVLTPLRTADSLEIYLNAGRGFHSNDARAVVSRPNPGTPLAVATGYDLGARTQLLERVDLAGSLWLLDLDSEIVWVGDEGVTEARGPTRRLGLDLEARAALLSWLFADVDLTVSRGRFRDAPADEDEIPLAPRATLTAGLSALHPRGFFGRLGLRSISDRPLTEDGFLQAEGFTLLDVGAGYRTGAWELVVSIDNLLASDWREAQFATASRVAGDPATAAPPAAQACPAATRAALDDDGNFAGCEDVHFTPGTPPQRNGNRARLLLGALTPRCRRSPRRRRRHRRLRSDRCRR